MQGVTGPTLTERRHSDAAGAKRRFAEATRTATFSLALGIREIRMLQQQPWHDAWAMMPQELGTLQKLIDKGLLEHTDGESPRLSKAGWLMRQLLIHSGHIVFYKHAPRNEAIEPEPNEADVVELIHQGLKLISDPRLEGSQLDNLGEKHEVVITTGPIEQPRGQARRCGFPRKKWVISETDLRRT